MTQRQQANAETTANKKTTEAAKEAMKQQSPPNINDRSLHERELAKAEYMKKNDAMRAADKAIEQGSGVDGHYDVESRQWAVSAGKIIYENADKSAKLAVGVAAHGRDSEIRNPQIGATFRVRF